MMYEDQRLPTEGTPLFVFDKPEVKRRFLDKVLQIVAVQLCITAALVFVARASGLVGALAEFFSALWVAGFVAILVTLGCSRPVAQKVPVNYGLLLGLTICQAFIIHNTTSMLGGDILGLGTVLTAVTTALAYFFAHSADFDFTSPRFLVLFNCAHFGAVLLCTLVFPLNSVILAYIGALVFTVYVIADLHMIMGSKSYRLGVDDYVFASVLLYVDVINLFLKLVQALEKQAEEKKKKQRRSG